tara:strand:+ start:505 stop:612 length:108 start_codon:yes stop_codon:yes gene_type:complete
VEEEIKRNIQIAIALAKAQKVMRQIKEDRKNGRRK